jgi:hypothetical protein
MPYTNVDIFREKRAKTFPKKGLGTTEFDKTMGKKIIEFNLNHKWLSPPWRKPIWF